MAGANMKDIKNRIKSVESTMQITKAMELVATSKLRRAKEKVEKARLFAETLREAISLIENSTETQSSVWSTPREGNKTLFITIAGDRGLAGGYNANLFRLTESLSHSGDDVFFPIGKKALEYDRHKEKNIYSSAYEYVADVSVGESLAAASLICESFLRGEFDRVVLVYTKFVSMISQVPVYEEILPLQPDEKYRSGKKTACDPIFGGDVEEILAKIVPEYIGGLLYASVCEARASESGARRSAMNSANKNAAEMIDSLTLSFNRARQAVITQEITEIVSGAEAL